MVSLSQIQEFCSGKDVLCVGNAECPKIDWEKYLVVRMNYGMKGGAADIWLNNICQAPSVHKTLTGSQKYILRLNGERDGDRFKRNYPPELHDKTFFWDAGSWKEMVAELEIQRPLTGTIALYWFRKYCQLKSLTLTGCNFFETKNIYANTDATNVHKVDKDKVWTMNLIDKGDVQWI